LLGKFGSGSFNSGIQHIGADDLFGYKQVVTVVTGLILLAFFGGLARFEIEEVTTYFSWSYHRYHLPQPW
jgi:hypothetical protein